MGAASVSMRRPLAATLARSACRAARDTGFAFALIHEASTRLALVVCQLHGGSRSALLGCLLNGRVDLGKPPVEVGNGVSLDVDLGSQRRVLRLDRPRRRPAIANMGGNKLCIDTRGI